jgi:hypothetical protein
MSLNRSSLRMLKEPAGSRAYAGMKSPQTFKGLIRRFHFERRHFLSLALSSHGSGFRPALAHAGGGSLHQMVFFGMNRPAGEQWTGPKES